MANVTEDSNGAPNISDADPWPFRMKLTTDHMRWDSLKIPPSKEFEQHILRHMNESSRQDLESWIPVHILIYDVDTCEIYEVKLLKKESFWFDPMPVLGERLTSSAILREPPCYDLEKAREEFAYSIEPFRQIVRRRDLKYDQEIGLRFSGSKVMVRLEFSALNSSLLDIHCSSLDCEF